MKYLTLILLLIATPAYSQVAKCGARAKMTGIITQRFKEKQFAVGWVSKSMVYEVFVSKRGSWTILATTEKGRSCVIGVGTNWSNVPLGLAGDSL